VTGTEVVKAIAAIPSYNNSQVTSATYVVQSSPQITGQWKWVGGSNRLSQSGVYGTLATPAATNVPGAHAGPATWTDQNGNLWLFGGYGRDANGHEGFLNDLWKYVPSAGVWTWMGGNNAINTSGAYGTQGTAAASNVPGARCLTTTWTDANGKLWLLGGYGIDHNGTSGLLNDLWTFDPVSGQWTWMTGSNIANVSGSYGTQNIFNSGNTPGARFLATGWVSGGRLWLFGGDTYDTSGVVGYTNDVWVYDPAQNQWEWVSGSTTVPGAGQALAPTYGPSGELSATNTPGGRHRAASWTDGNGNLWLFGGSSGSTLYGDLWMWDHTAQQWAWIEGGQGAPAGADSLGTFSATNLPPARSDAGTWTDANGNFWLFGGNEGSKVHDLWVFNPKTREWALMNGANSGPGIYGTKGMAAPENTPPPRTNAAAWTDSTGNLWLLGGEGTDSTCQLGASCVIGYENDLWEFQTPTIQ